MSTRESVVLALTDLTKEYRCILNRADELWKSSPENFVRKDISYLGKLIGAYATCFSRLGIVSRSALDNVISRCFRQNAVSSLGEELLELEEELSCFLTDVEKSFNSSLSMEETSKQRLDITGAEILDARTGVQHVAEVERHISEFETCKASAVVVSFGKEDGAKRWLETTKCSFPMVLDQKRILYHYFGLKLSVKNVWGIHSLTFYAEQKCLGQKLFAMEEEDDPLQLGGDFIIGTHGNIVFAHGSSSPTDRPSIDALLSSIRITCSN